MIRRLFWTFVGLGLGLVLGMRLLREVDRVTDAARPGAVAERTGRRVGGLQARIRTALEEGRRVAEQRELELRTRYGVPTLIDLASIERDQPGTAPDAD